MIYLRQSTPATIVMGPFVDSVDGVTPEVLLAPAVNVGKNGGLMAARSATAPISHDADGYYLVPLDATDTGTRGRLKVSATASGALPVWDDITVLSGAVYNALFGIGTNGPVNTGGIPSFSMLAAFPAELFDNEVTLYEVSEPVDDQGGTVPAWPGTGTTSPASVQPSSVTMVDPKGRVVISTQYSVLTPTDIGAGARDRLEWRNKSLIAQGPTMDEGGCGVLWKTVCTETN